MSILIRAATPDDIPGLVDLILLDARERRDLDRVLWKLAPDAPSQIHKALTFALTAEEQPFRQIWQVAEQGGAITGVIHAMLLPVPPIYAGRQGDPGLILPDSAAYPDAAEGTVDALVAAAERSLAGAGANVLLSAHVTDDTWREVFRERGYDPLTLYLAKTGLGDARRPSSVRAATEDDIPGIVARSAENRQLLNDIDPFWEQHPDADSRFSGWMKRSLTLTDRDMLVTRDGEDLSGYVIAQPASRLHFPPAHDITGVGVIDDFYHPDLADIRNLVGSDGGAADLLQAAEAAFVARGIGAAFVVCPAGWTSKIDLLRAAGYDTAMVWSIKR